MSVLFCNNNSLSAITTKPSGLSGGTMNLISTQTASSSATISFTSGIDSTYDEYVFKFYDMHPATDAVKGKFNFSTDGTNFNVTKTTTGFYAGHTEADATGFGFDSALAQSTSDGFLSGGTVGNADDECLVGSFFLFAPSSTTYVKHFMAVTNISQDNDNSNNCYTAGYFNTTSDIDAMSFEPGRVTVSTVFQTGTIKMYGIKDS